MVSIKVSQSQFTYLEEIVTKLDPNAKITEAADSKGHIHTSYIDADYEWRDVDGGYLVFTNEVKHGLYKFVSDDSIGTHLNAIIANLPLDVSTEPETADQPEGIIDPVVDPLVAAENKAKSNLLA